MIEEEIKQKIKQIIKENYIISGQIGINKFNQQYLKQFNISDTFIIVNLHFL
jgi:Mg2+/Co2+ transporter CorC